MQKSDPNNSKYHQNYYQQQQHFQNTDPQNGVVFASAPPFIPATSDNNNNNNSYPPFHDHYSSANPQPSDQYTSAQSQPLDPYSYGNYDYTPGVKPVTNPSFSDYGIYNNDHVVGNYGYAPELNPVSDPGFSHGVGSYDFAPVAKPDFSRNDGNYDFAPVVKSDFNRNDGNYGYAPGGDSGVFSDAGNYDNTPGTNHGLDGVYAYRGGNKEPYGARGTGSVSTGSSGLVFDDYGRPIGGADKGKGNGERVLKAALKDDVVQNDDMAGGVQKFRVRLLSEGVGQSEMDVLCQIGLDGIKLLDPATSRTLRIYPLESVSRWEVLDSYIFVFWAKTTIDMDSKRIRLKSNSYTSNNMLDTVTAASFQLKEISETKKSSVAVKISEQASEKKKGFPDWMNLMKPRNEEKDYWVPDEAVTKCTACRTDFNAFNRRHHCRNCGDIFCDKCTQGRIGLTTDENEAPVRVCDHCMAEVTQRLANVKESSGKVSTLQSHADLAKKLKEEMDKNRKTSIGLSSSGGTRMKDVACPTCTVHLQVQVPSSGSETIECSVCQHPFLVHA